MRQAMRDSPIHTWSDLHGQPARQSIRSAPAAAAFHGADGHAEGAAGRGWLEQPRCGAGGARLQARQPLYRLIKELWTFAGNRIAVRFAYEYHDDNGFWFRAYGNENWEFDANGLMQQRLASINEHPIAEADRRFRWPL